MRPRQSSQEARLLAAAPGRAQWWNLLPGERLPFASAAASALKRASYGCALPTTNHIEPNYLKFWLLVKSSGYPAHIGNRCEKEKSSFPQRK